MDFPPGWTDTFEITKDVVVNKVHGSLRLSPEASLEVARRAGLELVEEGGQMVVKGTPWTVSMAVSRDNPHLIAVVREMGEAASGPDSKLEVVSVKIAVKVEEDHEDFGAERISVWGGP